MNGLVECRGLYTGGWGQMMGVVTTDTNLGGWIKKVSTYELIKNCSA